MNRRKNLIIASICILLLICLLAPVAALLSFGTDDVLDQKQTAIARALEMEYERKKLSAYVDVQQYLDIEEIWAIEDTREETDEALIHAMNSRNGELGYDAQSRTFYCTLGLDNGDEWPEIEMKARGKDGIQVVWVGDYSYDACSQAIV